MSVTIDLELQAGDVVTEIGAIGTALETLDETADGVDLDFDNIDVDDITGKIGEMVDKLENMEFDLSGLEDQMDELDNLGGEIEYDVVINEPDGDVNVGDSTGSDPPDSSGSSDSDSKKHSGISGMQKRLRDIGGQQVLYNKGTMAELLHKPKAYKNPARSTPNFGASDSDFVIPDTLNKAVGVRKEESFGMEPQSMIDARKMSNIDYDEFSEKAGRDTLTDRFIETMAESQARAKFDALKNGRGSPFSGDFDADMGGFQSPTQKFIQRMAEQQAEAQLDALKHGRGSPFSNDFDADMGGFNSPTQDFINQMAESQARAKLDALKHGRGSPFSGDFDADMGGFQSPRQKFIQNMGQQMAEAKYEAAKTKGTEWSEGFADDVQFDNKPQWVKEAGQQLAEEKEGTARRILNERSDTSFRDLNENLRRGGFDSLGYSYDGVPETDAEIDAASSKRPDLGDFWGGTAPDSRGFNIKALRKLDLHTLNNGFSKIGKTLKKLSPSMGQYMQLLAALIPMLATFAVQALGVAAALGAVGVAGAALIGMGLLGHGETMAGSFAEAKERLQDLKREMFEVAQPTMQQFAPIQERAFNAIPGGMRGIFTEMQGLTAYEDTLFNLGGALAGGMERAFEIIVNNEAAISQLATRFGGIIGSGLLEFFSWLIKNASESQGLFLRLGKSFVSFAKVAFEVAEAVSKVVVMFRPLFRVMAFVAGILNNDFILGFLTIIAVFGAFTLVAFKVSFALWAVATALSAVGSGGVIGTIVGGIALITGKLYGLIVAAWQANAALGVLAGLATAGLAVGAAAVSYGAIKQMTPDVAKGSGAGAGAGAGGAGTVYNDNRSYEINTGGGDDYASQKRTEGVVKKVNETTAATNPPQ